MSDRKIGILFVCLGNICRSPLARIIFEDLILRGGLRDHFEIDSCGTGAWHAGSGADPRSVQIAAKYGLHLNHVARQLDPVSDFERFDLLIGMDQSNCATMIERGASQDRVKLMRSYDPTLAQVPYHRIDVPDPYYGGENGFDDVYHMLKRACEGLLEVTKPN